MLSKKVIVFIVEGISDKESLYGVLSELYDDREIEFSVVRGDITTDSKSKIENIESRITKYIKDAMNEEKFLKSDIERVVHIVDMDGAFIPDSNIVFNPSETIKYTDSNIETNQVDAIKNRNDKKRKMLNKLSTLHSIYKGLRYDMFYMSCNLEDVLHNIKNASEQEKRRLSEEFDETYFDDPEAFVKFFSEDSIAPTGNYEDTWRYIKLDLNSLRRHSNFNKFFEMMEGKDESNSVN